MRNKVLTLLAGLGLPVCMSAQLTINSGGLTLSVNEKGYYNSISIDGQNILRGDNSPMITVCDDGKLVLPAGVSRQKDRLHFTMADKKEVVVALAETPVCVRLEIVKIPDSYEAVVFGPIGVTIHDIVGEVVGVVQGDGVAFGMQSLNFKTTGGLPQEYIDVLRDSYLPDGRNDAQQLGRVPDFHPAAVDLESGAALFLSSRNRTRQQILEVENLKGVTVEAVSGKDAHIEGAAVAIFGCEASQALARIGEIEVEQGLPHPMFDGEWGKTARSAMRSYLITDLSEKNLDFVLDKAKQAGFTYIYHPGPFDDWGHFNWSKSFVEDGDEAVKALVDRAQREGVAVGVHTLTNFTTTNDAYVTPVPSKHLLKQGVLKLTGDIDDTQDQIVILKSHLFSRPMSVNAMMIDDELITYGPVEDRGDTMILKECRRGAFGTKASSHRKDTPLYKLWDHGYKTLFPDYELQAEFVDRLIDIFNTTGLRQISFDGLEGCCYTGHDDFARTGFVDRFYKGVDHNVMNDASNLTHYGWHIHSRMNWGEPWGEAMRTGQVESRIRNQEYFRRNLFPRMLGWFLIRLADRRFECSTLEDLEWALSESAGFDAGYAMNIGVNTLRNHGYIDTMLEAIKNWDTLRENQSFTPEQMERLKDPSTEWHLVKQDDTAYLLYPLSISKHYTCSLGELQPGQPGGADWSLDTPYGGRYAVRLRVSGDGSIENPRFSTASGTIVFPCRIDDGQYLLYDMDGKAAVTDRNYNVITEVIPEGNAEIMAGHSGISFTCDREDDSAPDVVIRFITRGAPETITR